MSESPKKQSSSSSYTALGYLRAAREWATPARKTSAFLEKGVLTPEEFVRAGDELVFRCPTWSWCGSATAEAAVPHLPPNKQYLITRRVPCPKRVAEMENTIVTDNGETEEDWLVSQLVVDNSADPTKQMEQLNIEDDFDILDEDGEVVTPPTAAVESDAKEQTDGAEEEEDEYADMADYEEDNILQDDDAVVTANTTLNNNNKRGDNLLKVRTYDLSITYDKYYQTPRVWMMGYSADGNQPLTGPEMLQDVMSDYANKTVTIEAHPHVSGPHASIHPCQHAKVMKTIVKNLCNNNNNKSSSSSSSSQQLQQPQVENYLFIFLKFVSSIIPTINYDFTMQVQADTSK